MDLTSPHDCGRLRRFGLLLFAAFSVLIVTPAAAQDENPLDTLAVGEWAERLVGTFSGSQAGYENWTEGGVSSLSLNANLRGQLLGVEEQWQQRHDLRLAYGTIKTEDRGYRKVEDVIRAASRFLYRGAGFWETFKPTLAADGRTQFARGYNYQENPFPEERELPVRVSDFMSPAFLSQTVGVTYDHENWLSQRVGLSSQQTIVVEESLRRLYGVDADELALIEAGVESQTDLERLILPRTRFTSSLTLFKSFRDLAIPDVYWENLLEIQANQWLTTNVSAVIVYNEDVSTALQFKEVISVGVSLSFI